jgi:gliding motility-associated-like protein
LIAGAQIEICDNGVDDDFDGTIDLNDIDCVCELIRPQSLIPNPSFEDFSCCPSDERQLICAASWLQASDATTDYINWCDWVGHDEFPPPLPFPDGNGIIGFRDGRILNGIAEPFWKEYAGACLLNPLLKDTLYRFQFDLGFIDAQKSPPIDITFYGSTDCRSMPFGIGNISFGCPSNSNRWIELGQVTVSGGNGNKWVNANVDIKPPENIWAITIGPACEPVETPVNIYYYLDNLVLADVDSFEFLITEKGNPCSNDFSLSVENISDVDYQWFKSGIAIPEETSSELTKNYGSGIYQVMIMEGESCGLTSPYDFIMPVFKENRMVTICEGDTYTFGEQELSDEGIYVDTLRTTDNCINIVTLQLEIVDDQIDTLKVEIIEGDTYQIGNNTFNEEGEYLVTLTSARGCDSLVFLELANLKIAIPNIFSPNDDGVNDLFFLQNTGNKIQTVNMVIYDRWGNLVYEGNEWDGLNVPSGVYIYAVEILFSSLQSKTIYGSVTIVK